MNPNEPQNTPAPEQPQAQSQPQSTEPQPFTPQPSVVEPQSAVPAAQPSAQPTTPEATPSQPTVTPAIPAATSAHRVNKVAYILLTFFLGGLGVHRFLRGQIGLGLLMIFFGWATFGIWWLVDFIISLTKLSVYPGDDYEFTSEGKFTL